MYTHPLYSKGLSTKMSCLKTLENSTAILQKFRNKKPAHLKPKRHLKLLRANLLLTLEVVVSILLVKGRQIRLQGAIHTLTKMMHRQTISSTDSENLEDRQGKIRNPIFYMKVEELLLFCSPLQDFSTAFPNVAICKYSYLGDYVLRGEKRPQF